ncbi:GerAB/ArcD/ProY family transporter [Alkalihalobacterium elongatum]|uniref:GerAB/ArcD/ProY family transporter n=1 Tax=Alkalihalobacterium elongatum TaxID=2675466 RepID=UPI001C1FBA64|nr:endospore germination permease [Alkalihalobacterium elongatum]
MLQRRAVFFFLFMSLPIMAHVLLLPMLWDISGRDVWVAAILSAPIGFLFAYLTWKLMNIEPKLSFFERTMKLFGNVLGPVLLFIWFVYFLFLASLTVSGLSEMLHIGFFEETPSWFFGILFSALIFYSVMKGIKIIAWCAGVLTIIIMISGHTISLMLSDQRTWQHLLPILEYGFTPVFWGVFIITAMWAEIFSLAVFNFRKSESKVMLNILLISVLINVLLIVSTGAGTISVFGLEQSQALTHPALSSVRMVSLGFIDRFDVYGLSLMTFGCFIRTGYYVVALLKCLSPALIEKAPKLSILGSVLIVYLLSLYFYKDKIMLDMMLVYYTLTSVIVLLPFIYLVRAKFKSSSTYTETESMN